MNPTRLSFGSTSPMVGGPFVSNQMLNGVPGVGQMGPSNPAFTPQTQAQPLPGQLPQQAPQMSMLPQAPQPSHTGSQMPQGKSESQLIIEALQNRLKHISDLERRTHEAVFGNHA